MTTTKKSAPAIMTIHQKHKKRRRPLLGAALITTLTMSLGACTSADEEDLGENRETTPPVSQETTPPVTQEEVIPEDRNVLMTKAITGTTYLATVKDEDDPLDGQEITIQIKGARSPEKGECGFEEAREFAEKDFAELPERRMTYRKDNPIDAGGTHHAALHTWMGSTSSMVFMILNGYAVHDPKPNPEKNEGDFTVDPRRDSAGLYAICPDFG